MISLGAQLRRVRRRLLGIGTAAAAVWGLAAVSILLLAGTWLDLLWEFPPEWRIATFWVAGVCGVVLLGALSAATLRAACDAAVARQLDRAGEVGGRILTGWELAQEGWSQRCGQTPRALTLSLANIAVADAALAAGQVPLGKVAPVRPLGRSLGAIALLWAAVAVLAICLPGLVETQWNRFARPFADVPPFSRIEFTVTPGNAPVVYGSELEIRATVIGPPVEQLELVLESGSRQEPPLPMFPEADGRWRAVLAKVVEPTDYYVRAYRARSKRYHLSIITVPLIENASLRIEPPAYANRAAYEGPLPKEGVSGLPGTKVQIFLRSNRPLGGGTIVLSGSVCGAGVSPAQAAGTAAPQGKPTQLPMKPIEPGSQVVMGQFSIAGDGKFLCRVIDEDGQESQQSFSGNVTMLADERPFVRITEPPKTSLATPTAVLPVTLSAEDDCGISRLQLYRSLNDSRPTPFDLPLPPHPSRRLDEQVRLPLDRYGLEPGDVDQALRPRGGQRSGRGEGGGKLGGDRPHRQPGRIRADVANAAGDRGDALKILRRPATHGIAGQENGRPAEEDERAARRCEAIGRDSPPARTAGRGDAARGGGNPQIGRLAHALRSSTRRSRPSCSNWPIPRRRWPRNWSSSSGRKTC